MKRIHHSMLLRLVCHLLLSNMINLNLRTWTNFQLYRTLSRCLQWGGFDAWSVASNECPSTKWSPSCKFSQSSSRYWTIQYERIYFFSKAGTKQLFLFETVTNTLAGDVKWDELYPDVNSAPFFNYVLQDVPSITNYSTSSIRDPPTAERRYLKRRQNTVQ